MSVTVDTEFRLPASSAGPAFSIDAAAALGAGMGWLPVQHRVLMALSALSERHGCEAVCWFCALSAPGPIEAAARVGALFSWDGPLGREHTDSLAQALGKSGAAWQHEGTRAIPRRAFPSVALKEGFPYQLWVEGRRGVNAPRLVLEDGELLQTRLYTDELGPEAFLDSALHAVAVVAPEDEAPADPIEAVKVVFALNVCERMVEADGVLAEGEIEFLRRVFPARRLESLGLQDRVRFLMLRQHAGDDLAVALTHEEKLSLMGLFWRAGQADGFVDGSELQILQQAAAQLQLDWDDVESYLRNLW